MMQDNEDICSLCNLSENNDPLVFNKNVEGTEINLRGRHAVEYQVKWRPEHSPRREDVKGYAEWKLYHYQ